MSASNKITYKSWLDTRWRFIAGLAVLVCSSSAIVLVYPQVVQLLPVAAKVQATGTVGDEIRRHVELSSTFRGYEWSQWNQQNLIQLGTLFAVLLGAGGVLSHGAGGGAFYTLALPVSRRRLIVTRAATGLLELLALMLLSSLVGPAMAPAIGESASLPDALAYALCGFIGGSVFFSLTLFLATVFSDVWRPLLIAVASASLIGFGELLLRNQLSFGFFRTMSAETYFRTGGLPWPGLLVCAASSAAMIYAAVLNLERRDF
ncbi:MAG: hypothetical protein GC155_13480 [Alphaproteobacteria bacterium]|nr:hypothetical protein [Alphaproteobacteria bacterium]